MNFKSFNLHMVPAKLSYFFSGAKDAALCLYINLFLIDIGFDAKEAGLISGLRLFGGLVGSPFWSYIADRKKLHRGVTLVLTFASIFLMISQPLVAQRYSKTKALCKYEQYNNTVYNITNYLKGCARNPYMKDRTEAFYSILFVNIILSFFDSSICGFIEAGVVKRCKAYGASFNMQRIFGPFGFSYGTYVTGLIIDHFPLSLSKFTGFSISYVFNMLLLVISVFFLLSNHTFTAGENADKEEEVEIHKGKLERSSFNQLFLKALLNRDILVFLLSSFALGFILSIMGGFSFVYFNEIGFSTTLMTIFMIIFAISDILGFFAGAYVMKKIDSIWLMLAICSFTYAVRFIPMVVCRMKLILIATAILQYPHSVFMISAIKYLRKKFSLQLLTTMCSLNLTAYFTASAIFGNIVGGILYRRYGGEILFGFLSMFSLVYFIFIMIYYFVDEKCKRVSKRVSESKEKVSLVYLV